MDKKKSTAFANCFIFAFLGRENLFACLQKEISGLPLNLGLGTVHGHHPALVVSFFVSLFSTFLPVCLRLYPPIPRPPYHLGTFLSVLMKQA